jgi:ATP-dependent helicase HrpA
MGTLKLWKWLEDSARRAMAAAGSTRAPGGTGQPHHKLSHRQQEQLLRENFINPRRVREWRDIHSQLHTVVAEQGWRSTRTPATYEQLHLSLLAGLLGNIGCKAEAEASEDWYLGARGIKFWRHPGAHLSKKPGRWIVAAELVETTRLFGRGLAHRAAVAARQLPGTSSRPSCSSRTGRRRPAEVVALERATLYGIVVYNRRVNLRQGRPVAAREIFIREAWWAASGTRAALHCRQPQADPPRSRSSNTRRAGRTCWWTTS